MTLAKVKSEAKRIGATVIDEKGFGVHECRVEAPQGKVWSGLGD